MAIFELLSNIAWAIRDGFPGFANPNSHAGIEVKTYIRYPEFVVVTKRTTWDLTPEAKTMRERLESERC